MPTSIDATWFNTPLGDLPLWTRSAQCIQDELLVPVVHLNAPSAASLQIDAGQHAPMFGGSRTSVLKHVLRHYDRTSVIVVSPCYALRGAPTVKAVLETMRRERWTNCIGDSLVGELIVEIYDADFLDYLEGITSVADPRSFLSLALAGGALYETPFDGRCGRIGPAPLDGIKRFHSLNLHRPIESAMLASIARTHGESHQWCEIPSALHAELTHSARLARLSRFAGGPARRVEQQPRVMLVSNASALSGAEESLCQLARGLTRRGYDVALVVGLRGDFSRRADAAGAHIIEFGRDLLVPSLMTLRQFDSTVSSWAPTVLHLNGACGLAPMEYGYRRGIPIVQHVRAWNLDSLSAHSTACDAFLSPSRFLANRLANAIDTTGPTYVCYDGTDVDHYQPDDDRRQRERLAVRIPRQDIVVTSIARLDPTKGQDLLIKACAALRSDGVPVRLFLVGEDYSGGTYAAYLNDLVEQHLAGSYTHFIDFRRDIRPIIDMSDVCALASRDEPLGTFILEAMAMAKPAVVSTRGGLAELIVPAVHGVLVDDYEQSTWASAIGVLASDSEARTALGAAARRLVVSHLSCEAHASAVEQAYSAVLGEAHREAARVSLDHRIA